MRIGIEVGVLREQARGVGCYLLNILNRFSPNATTDNFYLYSQSPIQYNLSSCKNYHYRFGSMPMPGSFWLQTQCKSLIKKDRVDVFFAPAHILPLGLSKNIKKVLSVHDLVSILYPKTMANYNRFVHNLFFKSSIKNADHIMTMSEFTKQSIINYFNIDKSKITVIYGGVNENFCPYGKEKVQAVLMRYGLKKPYILSVGTLEPRKNYSVLLQAFKNLNTDYNLVIVGKEGWKAKSIFNTIRTLQLENRINILGYIEINDLPYLYNGAELFVFPSIYEGFGLPVLEALACGVPTICSNASSLPEVGGYAVVYFNPNSVDELHLKMQQVLDSNQLRESLKEKSIIQAKKFNWDITAQRSLAVLKG
jgi:glycosyltransferase involved in cell wall biosynthesis